MAHILNFPVSRSLLVEKRSAPATAGRPYARLFAVWRDRITLRRALRHELLKQPDSVLEDAGWTRSAAQKEAAKPFWRA